MFHGAIPKDFSPYHLLVLGIIAPHGHFYFILYLQQIFRLLFWLSLICFNSLVSNCGPQQTRKRHSPRFPRLFTAKTKRLAAACLAFCQCLFATTNMGSTTTPYPMNPACPLDERLLRTFRNAQLLILMGIYRIKSNNERCTFQEMLFNGWSQSSEAA
jgi:hypothetical protein